MVVRAGLDVRFGPWYPSTVQVVGVAHLVDIEAGIFSGVSQKLNRPQVANSSVVWPTISPDGKWVIYLGDEDADQEQEMYRVPIAGGIATQISELPDFGVYESFAISPDSQRIVYTADREVDQRIELYSMSIMGGAVAKLSAMPAAGDIRSFAISPDGQSVVFEADRDTDDTYELYSVSIAGGTVTKLSSVQMVGDVYDFSISPDSRRVIYLADKDVDNQFDLYSVPITGGASIKLSALMPAATSISAHLVSERVSPSALTAYGLSTWPTRIRMRHLSCSVSRSLVGPSSSSVPCRQTAMCLIFDFSGQSARCLCGRSRA